MLVIRGARCFDGVRTWRRPVQIVVDDGRILEVSEQYPIASTVELIDLGDVTLLPGLVDAHTHLTWDASQDPVGRLQQSGADDLLTQGRRAARAALAVGITTVRDLGDRDYVTLTLRDELNGRLDAGPEVLAAGPPLTTTGGHCFYLGCEADTADALRVRVREHAARGVDVIKVMASGGEMTPGTRSHEAQFEREQLAAVVDEAHRLGLPVTAHAHAATGIADAVAVGCDGIEHGGFMTEDGVRSDSGVIAAMIRAGTVVTATPAGRGPLVPEQLSPGIRQRIQALVQVLAEMNDAGVRMAYASDAGIAPVKPHDVLPFSLSRALGTGWTAEQALTAMTSGAADACHVGHRKGGIAAGFDADILAVDGDPMHDPDALGRTRQVFRAGVPVLPVAEPARLGG